ncbi:hypothetical protein [Salinibacter sp.]|uniref:hypothetical protein n=1 Tax=Salinibacter sp. TaxID=2065818 RepID=UPI0021E79C8E|nr:hypothetical protein [Salinibacter sp.]
MRTSAALAAALLFLVSAPLSSAQPRADQHLDLEVEPLAYAFGGAGGHVGLQVGAWKYEIEAFRLEVPASLHGNDGFKASPRGVEIHAERLLGEGSGGFYLGPEVGLVRLDLTHNASGRGEQHTRYSVGVRGGYTWYPGLGNLYLSPVVGVSYTLNGDDVTIGGDTFESAPIGPWGTIGIGWSFSR